jgi:DMSO/TMAO reductase YedYZ molybdopterin-dependent catalytic subunit
MLSENSRVPPGQRVITDFSVLHYNGIPQFNPTTWRFKLFGLVEKDREFNYPEFLNLPKTESISDFHYVTGWSRFDNLWEGVSAPQLVNQIELKPEAKFVLIHCSDRYTTNIPLTALNDKDVIFAYRFDEKDITPEHGYPIRLVVPKLYAYKCAKWVNGIEFLAQDKLGYWEIRGYHNNADPWKEERFATTF